MDHRSWEIYHENSKQSPWYRVAFTEEEQAKRLPSLHLSLPALSEFSCKIGSSHQNLDLPLVETLNLRRSCRNMIPSQMEFDVLTSLLWAGFGITRPDAQPRPLRAAPSGGKSFPLECYFYAANCEQLPVGLYHFDSENAKVQLLKKGNHQNILAEAMVQQNIATGASLIFLFTGVFERSTAKYGERGYRMVLLEAGHVAQNINLAATALGWGCLNINAFFDRKIEDFLEIDGVNQSILYMIALGEEAPEKTT